MNDSKVQEILVAHGLDFNIDKVMTGADYKGEQHALPYYALFNSKTGLPIHSVKKGYTVSQTSEIVEMVLSGVDKFGTDLKITNAGALNGGRKVYFQLAINGMSQVGNDKITRYVTIIDSNDGSTGLSVGISDEVMHCNNQFFKFYAKGNQRFRHNYAIKEKIKKIPELIETALEESLKQIVIYNKFISSPVSRGLADKLVLEILGHDRVITSPEEYAKLGKRSLDIMDTLYENIETEYAAVGENIWGLFNGVTRFTTHEISKPKRENGFIESMAAGGGYQKNMNGFKFALKEAGILS